MIVLSQVPDISICFIDIKLYLYGIHLGLIWARKPTWGSCRTNGLNAQILSIWVSYIHVYSVAALLLDHFDRHLSGSPDI